ncbi:hypothetical protein AMEX_G20521 [Astyanax mexicanus]|uniref:Uncharacterized protein n=1 Tax=Astyanax mexicanus TaxID=7994 RepID=A0A8T2L4P2_ASTMX|nr:hypothetical protein AMEX_G20521 [Astyanax mexicanus]
MPAFIGYVAMFYIVKNVEKSATTSGGPDSQPEGGGSSDINAGVTNVPPPSSGTPLGKVETMKGSKCCITSKTVCQCFQYLIPSIVWIVLFLSDGRYVACYQTISAEHAESSQQALWEWCDLNQTLTAEQNIAEKSYYTSKLSGFGLLFLFSLLALVYQCFYVHGERCPTATHRWTRLTGRVV